jgi:acyl-CoA reductase-like NAD-dependent aldehyde dehydrogenase
MREFKLFINGEFCDAAGGETYESIHPGTGEVVASVAKGGAEDVARACAAAQAAFDGEWGALSSAERAGILGTVACMIERDAEELAELEMLDVGKPINEATNIDVPVAANYLRWYSQMTNAPMGETIPLPNPANIDYSLWQPYGVCGGIVPWNFPLFLAVLKIGGALATGNCMVIKPAGITPMTTLKLAELFAEANLPEGALNVITGPGATVGEALVTDPRVRMVSFTGSTATGRRILELATRNITDVSIELGGKSPNIIFADADFDQAVAGAVFGILLNNGQNCIAGSRLLVEESIYEDVVDAVASKLASLRIGQPADESTQLGAIVSREQFGKIMGYIEQGKAEGARLVHGSKAPEGEQFAGGFFIEPTLFADVSNQMTIAREEIFGPVLVAIPFADEAEALRIANDTPYGLGSGVFTTNADRIERMVRGLQSGTVYVNTYNQVYPQSPFPGWKQSGNGAERGLQGLYAYVRYKNVIQEVSGAPIGWFGA